MSKLECCVCGYKNPKRQLVSLQDGSLVEHICQKCVNDKLFNPELVRVEELIK